MAKKNTTEDRLKNDIGKIVQIELNEETTRYLNIGEYNGDFYKGSYMFVNNKVDSLHDGKPYYEGIAVFPLKMEYVGEPRMYRLLFGGNINPINVAVDDVIDKLWDERKHL